MKKLLVLLVGALLIAAPAVAIDCGEPCAEGEKRITYGDGNNATCVCMAEGAGMEDGPSGCPTGDCTSEE